MIFTLTQAGKKRSKDIRAKGAKSSFLISIAEAGPSTLEDIAIDLRVPIRIAKKIANDLIKAGLVKRDE